MSNPFATESTAASKNDDKSADAPAADLGFSAGGDPFADPSGISDATITDFVGRLLLIKPTEIVAEMRTSQGPAHDVVRVDMAVLDDPEEAGKRVDGILLFQTALKREAANVYRGPNPYLLGRLSKGKTQTGNTIYTFDTASDEDKDKARQYLAVKAL